MNRTLLLSALLALTVAAPASAEIMVGDFEVAVLESTSSGPVPVLYVVPGAGVSAARGSEHLALAESPIRKAAHIAVVAERDGDLAGFNFVTDYFDGTKPLDTQFVDQVVPAVERRVGARPAGRAIAGYSAGGYSAAAIASRHPGMFAAVGTFSGAVDIAGDSVADRAAVIAPNAISGDTAVTSRWGDPVLDEDNWRAQNPTDLAHRLARTPVVYVASGDGTPASPEEAAAATVPQYVAEWQVAAMSARYSEALDAAGVAHTYRPRAGLHRPEHWREDLRSFWALACRAGGRRSSSARCPRVTRVGSRR